MFVKGYEIKSNADLSYANLSGANLSNANLRYANLSDANLSNANLSDANLSNANLSNADLSYANLSYAYLRGALWKTGNPINHRPIQIFGLNWSVLILDRYMQIGCQCHSLGEWHKFSDEEIIAMDGRDALHFWRQRKKMLLSLAENQQEY